MQDQKTAGVPMMIKTNINDQYPSINCGECRIVVQWILVKSGQWCFMILMCLIYIYVDIHNAHKVLVDWWWAIMFNNIGYEPLVTISTYTGWLRMIGQWRWITSNHQQQTKRFTDNKPYTGGLRLWSGHLWTAVGFMARVAVALAHKHTHTHMVMTAQAIL